MREVLCTEGLTKRFGTRVAVDKLSLSIREGECVGLLGPNGAGKTTTIRVLIGELVPSAGTANIAGYDVLQTHITRKLVGVVFDCPNVYPRLSVDQNMRFFAGLRGASAEEVLRTLDYVGLSDRRRDQVQKLSKGLVQRLLIARALLNAPKILLLDEPTAGLDPNGAHKVRECLRALKRQGVSMLLCTHNMLEAQQLCDRVAIINHGRLVAFDSPSALCCAHGKKLVRLRRPGSSVWEEVVLGPAHRDHIDISQFITGPFEAIEVQEPTLEHVFVSLTGGKLSQDETTIIA